MQTHPISTSTAKRREAHVGDPMSDGKNQRAIRWASAGENSTNWCNFSKVGGGNGGELRGPANQCYQGAETNASGHWKDVKRYVPAGFSHLKIGSKRTEQANLGGHSEEAKEKMEVSGDPLQLLMLQWRLVLLEI